MTYRGLVFSCFTILGLIFTGPPQAQAAPVLRTPGAAGGDTLFLPASEMMNTHKFRDCGSMLEREDDDRCDQHHKPDMGGLKIKIGKPPVTTTSKKKNPPSTTVKSTTKPDKRAKKKGGGGKDDKKGTTPGKPPKNGKPAAPPPEETEQPPPPPPTPLGQDPKDGIDVAGGKLIRGTGPYVNRPAIFCWIKPTDKKACETFAFYQFMKVDFTDSWNDGPVNDANEKAKKLIKGKDPGIKTATGAYVKPGEWSADDFPKTLTAPREGTTQDTAGNPVKGGQYELRQVDGLGKAQVFVDAPNWLATFATSDVFEAFAPAELQKAPAAIKQVKKPDKIPLGSITLRQQFRTYLHCLRPKKECLGYFTWEYSQTLTYAWEWQTGAKEDMGDDTFNKAKPAAPAPDQPKLWKPITNVTSTVSGPQKISKWEPDCSK